MAKPTTAYVCQNCGESFPKWQGQCSNCGQWNTLVETIQQPVSKGEQVRASRQKSADPTSILPFSQVQAVKGPKHRFSTLIGELDRVLGESFVTATGKDGEKPLGSRAGMVPGAVMLIGGEPGIGKSTLLTQMVVKLLVQGKSGVKGEVGDGPLMYISGEESPNQISMRINRILEFEQKNTTSKIGKTSGSSKKSTTLNLDDLVFVTTTDVDEITTLIREHQPRLVIVDSIQTLHTTDLVGSEGSVGQLRESTQRITETVKRLGVPTFLVGHVTKEGTIAGPKVLEHIVDAVLELTGERTDQLRILRAIKNRFGATDEVGVFRVNEYGLEEVANPSEMLLEHSLSGVAGSATVCVMEGTRPLLVEVQALVVDSPLAMPRRVGRGVDLSRIQVLAAVLQKHAYLPLGTSDIFVNVAGGFVVKEPSIDLGLAVAIVSSLKNKPLPAKTLFIGEVGLLGEIRNVNYLDRRIKEAHRLGYTKIYSRKTHTSVYKLLKDLGLIGK